MGYCATAYRVDFGKLNKLRGSRDRRLLTDLRTVAPELSAYREGDDDDEGDDDGPIASVMRSIRKLIVGKLTLEKAIERIINGKSLDPRHAGLYLDALEVIIRHTSPMLDNSAVAPADPQHFTDVDEAFKSNGIDGVVSMSDLIFGGPPIAMPPWHDWPQVGHMTPDSVRYAKGRIASKDWSAFSSDVQATVALVDQWIDEASSKREGLVCFYA